jgi:hypothetical protein
MKSKTVIKILTRYAKSLQVMENEAIQQDEIADSEHYRMDRLAIEQAIKCVERSNA